MADSNTSPIVTQRTLALYDKYDEDFGLLDERWADKKDRDLVTDEEAKTLGQYVDHLHDLKNESLSKDLKKSFMDTLERLESLIEHEVAQELRKRVNQAKLNEK